MRIPSEDLQKRIVDTIRYRFYDRLDLYDVYRWLDNFQDNEQEMAVSLLEKLEYYREEDLSGILSSTIDNIVNDVWEEINKPFRILFMPLGKPGKSGHFILYLVKNLFKKNTPNHIKSILYYNHPKDINIESLNDEDVVIFLDDIIGSGDSFATACELTFNTEKNGEITQIKNEWTIGNVVKEHAPYKIVLLSCIIMDKGKRRLERELPYVKLYGDVRVQAFSKKISPFGGYYKMKKIREFCHKYGQQLCKGQELGYSNSQALILFAHAIPNNTLPIIWIDKYKDENNVIKYWQPLIARNHLKKQNMAFNQRMDNNRWVFKLSQFFRNDSHSLDRKIIQDKNIKLTYILRCLEKRMPEVLIANDMGLTNNDMTLLFEEGEKIGLWNKDHNITKEAQNALDEAYKRFKMEKEEKDFLCIDDKDYMYIPETFKGMS